MDELSDTFDFELNKSTDSTYHLAVAGPTLGVICSEYPELLDHLICVCDVYARMSPDQKQLLVNKLQDVDYTVAMCGDGANDCAALKVCVLIFLFFFFNALQNFQFFDLGCTRGYQSF